MREGDHGVAAFDQVELDFDHPVDGIAPEQPEHDHRHGKSDTDDRECTAQRAAGEIADRQHMPRRQGFGPEQSFDPGTAKAPRRGRPHGNRRRQHDHVAQRRDHAEGRGQKADREAEQGGPWRQREVEGRQAKKP